MLINRLIARGSKLQDSWYAQVALVARDTITADTVSSMRMNLQIARDQRFRYHLYFQQVHPIAPMIHKRKFSKALEGDPQCAPPLALRYAMWATAALTRMEHQDLAEDLYVTARKEAEKLEVKVFSVPSVYCIETYET